MRDGFEFKITLTIKMFQIMIQDQNRNAFYATLISTKNIRGVFGGSSNTYDGGSS